MTEGKTSQPPERHRGPVTLRRDSIPLSTADQRLLDSRGRAASGRPRTPGGRCGSCREFVEGFDTLADLPPAVSVFGSARSKPDSPECELAERARRGAGPGRLRGDHRRWARA